MGYARLLSYKKETWPFSEKGKCRQCGDTLTGRRTAYCSDACSLEFSIPRVWSVAVGQVWRRDKGICALCGRDPAPIKATLRGFKARIQDCKTYEERRIIEAERQEFITHLNREGFHLSAHSWGVMDGELWQVDHILPVVEGGGGCGLSNLRTLCTGCHKKETKALAARRANANRKSVPKMASDLIPSLFD